MSRGAFFGVAVLLTVAGALAAGVLAQGPPLRQHRANEARPVVLVPADRRPPAENRVSITIEDGFRVITANDIPNHAVGAFPNRGNPHTISEQRWSVRLPLEPVANSRPVFLHDPNRRGPPTPFGIGVNGVLFDPGTAEYWMGDRESGWNYEALGGAVPLGLDANHAHVQPGGIYHYHGLPTGLLEQLGRGASPGGTDAHSPVVGWAADGFPIYSLFGFETAADSRSGIRKLTSSYRLKPGQRPGGVQGPGGRHDGAFVQDYEFVDGAGDLDECNGRTCVTPEFPEGTYAYFLTVDWPVIPRAFRGAPVSLHGPAGNHTHPHPPLRGRMPQPGRRPRP